MTDPKTSTIVVLVCTLLVAAPAAVAQNGTVDWQGQDSEFGTIRAPYVATMDGARIPVEARIVLKDLYTEKDSTFFMFAFTVENTPLDVDFDNLIRMDTNEEMACFKTEGTSKDAIKCSVDIRDMPPAGTEIRMYGTIGANKNGQTQVGAMVIPFTYAWARVQMSNGLNAELYAGTQVNVKQCTSGKCGLGGIDPKGAIPGVGALGVAGAAVIAVGLLALRRRS